MRGRRRLAAPLLVVVAVALAACAPALPETVVPGSSITAGWTGEFTSANAAAAPTPGNLDIAATMRSDFGALVDGEFVPDEGFGAVTIVSDDPFTVKYDLAEPAWSDGIPLDAADLLLGWAAASGYLDLGDEASADAENGAETDTDLAVPSIDEFARSIQVTFPQPVSDWQHLVTVPVPAHIVARLALGVDDAMEAKQAVITAIQDDDETALEALAEAWNEGFEIADPADIPADLLLSSGPFRVTQVESADGGQSVTLVPNAAYRGLVTAKVAEIHLVPPGPDPIATIGQSLDVARVVPVTANREQISQLERKDFTVDTAHDGTVWSLLLRPVGILTSPAARTAFLRTVPASAMVERGGAAWASAYAPSTSMVTAPGSRAYDIVNEDSGFAEQLGEAGDDPAAERAAAGIGAGAQVCVLYDRASEFAAGAFAALRDAAAEAGWNATDCGTDDLRASLAQGTWDAVITRVPVPQNPLQIAAQWGSGAPGSLTGSADPERDELIARLAQTTDIYAQRDLLAQIEATIVRAAVARPIAMNPTATIIDKDVTGIAPRNGSIAPLTSGVAQWTVVP